MYNLTVEEQFTNAFEQWVKDFQPTGDTSALKAIAWIWYARGNDFAIAVTRHEMRTFDHEKLCSRFATEQSRFLNT